jgi:flavin-dependent dehydrogenase
MKQVHIIGGGLAGLSLGIALRTRGVPVRIDEAGTYPRHRVCGEFITGIDESAFSSLGIHGIVGDALTLNSLAWFQDNEVVLQRDLPRKAWGISRWNLDQALAQQFVALGGNLHTGIRKSRGPGSHDGMVWATGRRPMTRPGGVRWIGLKVHLKGIEPEADLELHMGHRGYAGLSLIEDGKLNLCGLFQQTHVSGKKGKDLFVHYLEDNGLERLAALVEEQHLVADSFSAVAGMDYRLFTRPEAGFVLGDSWSLIPPFTGNGMSMAFESALLATEPLVLWAEGECNWIEAERKYQRQLKRFLRGRILRARFLHGLLLSPLPRKILASLARTDSLPFRALYAMTH